MVMPCEIGGNRLGEGASETREHHLWANPVACVCGLLGLAAVAGLLLVTLRPSLSLGVGAPRPHYPRLERSLSRELMQATRPLYLRVVDHNSLRWVPDDQACDGHGGWWPAGLDTLTSWHGTWRPLQKLLESRLRPHGWHFVGRQNGDWTWKKSALVASEIDVYKAGSGSAWSIDAWAQPPGPIAWGC